MDYENCTLVELRQLAKEKGVIFGRPKIQLPNNIDNVFSLYLNKQIKIKEALKITKLSCGSFYKYYNIYKNDLYFDSKQKNK